MKNRSVPSIETICEVFIIHYRTELYHTTYVRHNIKWLLAKSNNLLSQAFL